MATLSIEDTASADVDAVRRSVAALAELPAHGPEMALRWQVTRALTNLLAATRRAEEAGCPPSLLRQLTAGARAFCRASRTLAHAQDWPRGYAGDFEMVERLIDGAPAGASGSLEQATDAVVLDLPIVQQHRNKVRWQANLVRGRVADSARVLSIACGGSRDLASLEPALLSRIHLVLSDFDAAALALSDGRLRSHVRSLITVCGNVLGRLVRLESLGPFDVVVIGGLLDYLPDRAARLLLTRAVGILQPGGVLGLTNIAADNPFRHMLELLTDWTLIERDADGIRALLTSPGGRVTLTRDETGLTWLATFHATTRENRR